MITMLTHHWLERDLRLSCLFSISLNVDNELDKPEILSLIITLKSTFRRIISINTVHITTSSISDFPTTGHYFQRGAITQARTLYKHSSQSTD
jgi:hypothetical protein